MGGDVLAKVLSSAVIGIDACLVEVEVDISQGLPAFTTVGLPETSVKESKERVKSAISNSGYDFPFDRITVNLAPASIKKEGTGFDLPVALGILSATGIIPSEPLNRYMVLGELSLDGRIKPVKGSLPMAITARDSGYQGIIVPYDNRREAAVVKGIPVYSVKNLPEVVDFLRGVLNISSELPACPMEIKDNESFEIDFSEVIGQEHAKRALEVASAGGHNLIMIGPPGSGKTMLARRISTILPPLSFEEAIETTKIYSVAGMLKKDEALITRRPFRAPHHTISDAGLIGGGRIPKPGEVSLAHNGVLFLDELPEFKTHVLEVLRQPIEDQRVTIARVTTTITYPSCLMLVAAMNPCPCGYSGSTTHECRCTPAQRDRYRSRISGPLLDRIDIHVEVPSVPYKELSGGRPGEPSATIRERVFEARAVQANRYSRAGIHCNAQMSSRHIRRYCAIDNDSTALLERAVRRLGLSARAFSRVLKISRTIADLAGSDVIRIDHISEAIQYRNLDRKL